MQDFSDKGGTPTPRGRGREPVISPNLPPAPFPKKERIKMKKKLHQVVQPSPQHAPSKSVNEDMP